MQVSFHGTAGSDFEIKQSAKGSEYATGSVAYSFWDSREQERKTLWVRCTTFGRSANFAGQIRKGDRVIVSGELKVGAYTNKSGEVVASADVVTADITSFAVNKDEMSARRQGGGSASAPAPQTGGGDLPF